MKIRIATEAKAELQSALIERQEVLRALDSSLPLWLCAVCGAEKAARDLRGIRRGDVIIPLCNEDAPGRTSNLNAVIRSWITERKRRAAWQQLARLKEESVRRAVRRNMAA